MSDRKDHIEQLKALKILEDSLGEISGYKSTKVSQALEFAINSLETDEAYQLEYKKAAYITLDELKELREEIDELSTYTVVPMGAPLIKRDSVVSILDKKISELEKQ